MRRILSLAFLFILVGFTHTACGGGSEGTGTTRSISGSVKLVDGSPITSATVTILETSDSAITDESGSFFIQTESDAQSLNLQIEKGELQATTELGGLDNTTSNLNVELVVEVRGDAALVSVEYLEVWARIVGECEKYFYNGPIIEQRKNVPDNLSCVLRFFASGDGRPLERIRGRIEVRSCNSTEWRPIAEGLTGTGSDIGFGDITFDYIDNNRNCVYRLVAPINDPKSRSFAIEIHTKTFQNR